MKKIYALILALFMALALTACSGSNDSAGNSQATSQDAPPSHTHNYSSTITNPTCTENGYTTFSCACGDSYTTDETAATGHSYTQAVTAPTCTKNGYTKYTCACGDSYTTDETAATGHSYTQAVIAPTCTKNGYTKYTCACGHSYTTDETAATGHSYTQAVTAPTCTKKGYTTYTCSCGHSYVSDYTEASHKYSNHVCVSCGKIDENYQNEYSVTEKLKRSVVKVVCYNYDGETEMSQGSGFFIDDDGTFITNAHVVKDCFYIKITTYLGATYDVNVLYTYNGTVSDYAICKAKNCYGVQPVEFATTASVGDTVYALGYPNNAYIMKTTKGKITSTNAAAGTKNYYANTAWIDHGSSGGILADTQGRVLGITTGIFSNGEYAALKYQDFKFDVEGIHTGYQTPLEYFHTVDTITLGSYNIDDYFDVFVDATATSDTRVSYQIILKLKSKYQNAKIRIDSSNIHITMAVTTEYKYKEIMSYGTANQRKTDVGYLYFRFYSEDDLIAGDSQFTTSSIFISTFTQYYDMEISYDIRFSGGSGTLIIYDQYA